jgi:hypothetical protein
MGLWASQKAAERRKEQLSRRERRQVWRQRTLTEARGNGDARRPGVIFRERAISGMMMLEALRESGPHSRRQERLELFGYVKTKNGITLTIDEASYRLTKGLLRAEDIAEWVNPNAVRDVLSSPGEIDAVRDYPMLGIPKGTVLIDPKIRVVGGHKDPALKRL